MKHRGANKGLAEITAFNITNSFQGRVFYKETMREFIIENKVGR